MDLLGEGEWGYVLTWRKDTTVYKKKSLQKKIIIKSIIKWKAINVEDTQNYITKISEDMRDEI